MIYIVKRTSDDEIMGWCHTEDEAEEWIEENSGEYIIEEVTKLY